jgi:hypothetical protein
MSPYLYTETVYDSVYESAPYKADYGNVFPWSSLVDEDEIVSFEKNYNYGDLK